MFRRPGKTALAELAKSPAKYMMLCALRQQLHPARLSHDLPKGIVVCVVPDGWLWHAKSAAVLLFDSVNGYADDDFNQTINVLRRKPKEKGPVDVPILRSDRLTIYFTTSMDLVSVSLQLSADAIFDVKPPSGRHFNFARRAVGLDTVPIHIAERIADCSAEVVVGLAAKTRLSDVDVSKLEGQKTSDRPVKLSELPGYSLARPWVADLKSDVECWRRGEVKWADVDRGILLIGEPGTGKTFFARALAAELGFDVISTSVAEWQGSDGGHLGTTIAAMRASFRDAASRGGAVLFVDELDSLGDRSGSSSQHSYYENNIINSFLELTSGMLQHEGTVLVAATNHLHLIDPAVLRSGRLEEHVRLDLPNEAERAEILSYHLDRILAPAELRDVTDRLSYSTAADFERLARHAKRAARKRGGTVVIADVEAALPKRVLFDEDTHHRVAVHEAGHALAALASGFVNSVTVTVEQSIADHLFLQRSGHVTYQMQQLTIPTDKQLLAQLRIKLAGTAAEDVVFGSRSIGAGGQSGSDLDQATRIAMRFAGSYGLGKSLRYQGDADLIAHDLPTSSELKAEVDNILLREYRAIKELLAKEKPRLLGLAAELVVSGEIRIDKS